MEAAAYLAGIERPAGGAVSSPSLLVLAPPCLSVRRFSASLSAAIAQLPLPLVHNVLFFSNTTASTGAVELCTRNPRFSSCLKPSLRERGKAGDYRALAEDDVNERRPNQYNGEKSATPELIARDGGGAENYGGGDIFLCLSRKHPLAAAGRPRHATPSSTDPQPQTYDTTITETHAHPLPPAGGPRQNGPICSQRV